MEHSSTALRDPDDWWWIFDPRQSLRARAVVIFGGLALAFSLLLGWVAETHFRQQLAGQIGPTFETLAFQIGDKLDRALAERQRVLQLTAQLASLKNPATPAAERRALLDALLNVSPDCVWLGFANRDGEIVAEAPQFFEGTSVAEAAWFRGARRAAFIDSVRELPDLARELPSIGVEKPRFLALAVPVNDARGNFLGVLGAQMSWSWARDMQHSVVTDVARREHIDVTIYAPDGEVLLDSGATNWTQPPEAPKAAGDRSGARGYFSEPVPNEGDYLTGYVRTKGFREFRGVNWLVTVRQPVADAFAAASDVRRWIVRTGAVFTVAIAVLSWLIAGRITRRMAAIAAAAGRIRNGDVLSEMPRPPGHGEIESMCGALGDMVDDLRQKNEQLDANNTRLTVRLSERVDKPDA